MTLLIEHPICYYVVLTNSENLTRGPIEVHPVLEYAEKENLNNGILTEEKKSKVD